MTKKPDEKNDVIGYNQDHQILTKLGDKVMDKMLTLLMDFNALNERLNALTDRLNIMNERLTERINQIETMLKELKEDTKYKESQKVSRWSLYVAISVGITQICLILYQIFRK